MSLPGETVEVLTAAEVADPYADDPWASPTEVAVAGVLCEPRPSSEPVQDARNAVVSGWTLYFPAGSTVTPANKVRVRGIVHDVLGEPADWRLGSWRPGLVVQCARTEG